jgi:hypothetical protein
MCVSLIGKSSVRKRDNAKRVVLLSIATVALATS